MVYKRSFITICDIFLFSSLNGKRISCCQKPINLLLTLYCHNEDQDRRRKRFAFYIYLVAVTPINYCNILFFQSALCRQSAVVTKSLNQGQSGTRQGQIGTRVGQIGTGEGQIGTGEGQLEIADRVLEPWFSRKNEISI